MVKPKPIIIIPEVIELSYGFGINNYHSKVHIEVNTTYIKVNIRYPFSLHLPDEQLQFYEMETYIEWYDKLRHGLLIPGIRIYGRKGLHRVTTHKINSKNHFKQLT